ncbi:MAG: leucine-rich repeat protein [Bacilli bacterium]
MVVGCQQELPFIVENSSIMAFDESILEEERITIPEGIESILIPLSLLSHMRIIDLPSTFKNIQPLLFENCTSLEQINISSNNANYLSIDGIVFSKSMNILVYYPEGKTNTTFIINAPTVGKKAFFNNHYLKQITMTELVLKINPSSFENCSNIEAIILSENLLEIPDFAFRNCVSLNTIVITGRIKRIDEQAFANATALANVTIPSSVFYIEKEAFKGLTIQQNLIFEFSNPFILWSEEWDLNCLAQKQFTGPLKANELYLALGDSLAAGHMSDNTLGKGYSDYLGEKLVLANIISSFHNDFAQSGMTSWGLLYRLKHPDFFQQNNQTIIEEIAKAKIITISIGANDLMAKLTIDWSPFSLSYDISEINEAYDQLTLNYLEIISLLKTYNQDAEIYLIGYYMPLPYFENYFSSQDYAMFSKLDATISSVASQTQCRFIDISTASSQKYIPNPLNIHPGEEGYQYISSLIFEEMLKNK